MVTDPSNEAMMQSHYEQQDSASSQILVSLYACVFEPERFPEFLNLLDATLSDAEHHDVLLSLERPTEKVLERLVAEERETLTKQEPWLVGTSIDNLKDQFTALGYMPLGEDVSFLRRMPPKSGLLRILTESNKVEWCVAVKTDDRWECYRSQSSWHAFLSDSMSAQFKLTQAELCLLYTSPSPRD